MQQLEALVKQQKIIYIYTSCRSANESIGKAVKCPAIC
ncbi:hypothetical protein AT236_01082 [Lactobacillus delbrueckii subsp. bulgaricus]|nr:hypothetical protein AT236_01056 [Lactobacillus delbrueckii subsp. bulgaricus]ALT47470.1 hypothetical protein AT236_01082 [Lactobacillus delbrueckii subsp. bulgaricus]AQR53236.1 hypothetical protein BBD26_0008 [Lactobacillus delbrueckii subsp. bulgaricus]AQR53256.1 hypothetical protein BBD26_0028 [Lactobacillus delbrueckii subsp. bulgaricus]EHE89222.1 hypothetical protein LDBUL1519_01024 [Lactobacillus delbrueckii subsp. bulgaricus CNCM I-1519]